VGGGSGTDNNSDRPDVEPQSGRTSFFTYLDADVTDNFNVYFQGIYAKEMVKTTNAGGLFSATSGQPMTIYSGNPFLPASLQAQMTANHIASFTFGRVGNSLDLANNAYVENDTKVRAGTLGFKANVSDGFFKDWKIDGNYQFGETNLDARQIGGIRLVNAGSVGMPYEDLPGARWCLLGPDIQLRTTPYDRVAAAERIRATELPDPEEFAEVVTRPPTAQEATREFEALAGAGE